MHYPIHFGIELNYFRKLLFVASPFAARGCGISRGNKGPGSPGLAGSLYLVAPSDFFSFSTSYPLLWQSVLILLFIHTVRP
jgi:hypothetical protein